MENVLTDFTEAQVMLMMKIHNYKGEGRLTISRLAHAIKINPSAPSFNKVIRYLFEIRALECVEQIATAKIIKINKRRVRDLIDEQAITNKFYDYFEAHHFCKW